MEKAAKKESENVLDTEDPEQLIAALKDEFIKYTTESKATLITHDLKLKQLMPLVQSKGDKEDEPAANPIDVLEKKFNKKIANIDGAHKSQVN